jgi:hypothetical protein
MIELSNREFQNGLILIEEQRSELEISQTSQKLTVESPQTINPNMNDLENCSSQKIKAPGSLQKLRVPRLDLGKLSPMGSPVDNKNYNLSKYQAQSKNRAKNKPKISILNCEMLYEHEYTPVLLKFSNKKIKIYINREIKIVPI